MALGKRVIVYQPNNLKNNLYFVPLVTTLNHLIELIEGDSVESQNVNLFNRNASYDIAKKLLSL
jgi:hypothetical protein